ncbi:Lrp/AsnC family transcriptional regulator [Streptomyces geranii]|uniref:Lrp/AsnC family transcriptional regulator n=1 Tax=Streptomyces geranii TaxID=2058923 RepID=UPI0018E4DE04|nr:Lrp/AsnC family transcriptional regulator [Streptomyces geranii]
MRDFVELDELELKLVNALQISPRASWTLIASVLDIDPATAARRWQRLVRTGRAWISVYPGAAGVGAVLVVFVEVGCAAGTADAVAERLAADTRVATIEHITGGSDLLLTVLVGGLAALSEFLVTDLGVIPGVTGTRAQVATRIVAEAARWTLRALTAAQRQRILSGGPRPVEQTPRPIGSRDLPLLTALSADGRASYSHLADASGLSISTVRRRLDSLLVSKRVIIRCEVAQPLSGWPVAASLWCRVPPARHDAVTSQLASLPETRQCVGITGGRANLLLTVWLRSVADMQVLQAALVERITDLEVLHTALALRQVKRIGRVLDRHEHARETVPLDLWPLTIGV